MARLRGLLAAGFVLGLVGVAVVVAPLKDRFPRAAAKRPFIKNFGRGGGGARSRWACRFRAFQKETTAPSVVRRGWCSAVVRGGSSDHFPPSSASAVKKTMGVFGFPQHRSGNRGNGEIAGAGERTRRVLVDVGGLLPLMLRDDKASAVTVIPKRTRDSSFVLDPKSVTPTLSSSISASMFMIFMEAIKTLITMEDGEAKHPRSSRRGAENQANTLHCKRDVT